MASVGSDLLVTVIAAELIVLVTGLAIFLLHAVSTGVSRRRTDKQLLAASDSLQTALDDPGSGPAVLGSLVQMPRSLQIRLLCAVAPSLGGVQRGRLTAFAQELGILAIARRNCRSRLWWRRLQGARLLRILGTGESVVPELLGDPDLTVRTEAVRWVAGNPQEGTVDRLLEMLGDDASARCPVEDALIRIGRPVTGRLAEHLWLRDGEALKAGLRVAIALADTTFLAPALKLCESDDPDVRAWAAELVGAIGGQEAVGVLAAMLTDPAPRCRATAAHALGRLGHWPAASSLADLLGDRAWEVRQHAGAALRSLGSPGALFLRRSLAAEDPFAADVARQMLDLPDSAIRSI